MKKSLIPLLFLLPLVGSAQFVKLNQGDFEVSGSAGYDESETMIETRLGYFMYDYVQTGFRIAWADSDFATRTHFGFYSYRIFETREYLLPYVGGGLGYGNLDGGGKDSESGIELTFLAGLKYYLADNVSLNTEFSASVSTGDSFLSDEGAESSEVAIRIGISYLW